MAYYIKKQYLRGIKNENNELILKTITIIPLLEL